MAFTVCTLNCNGIRSAGRKGFEEWLKKNKPDVLCLQELRAWPEQVGPELLAPEGYHTHWVNAEKKGYSGVAVYSRQPFDAVKVGLGLDWGDAEGRFLRVEIGDLVIISVYVPSGSSKEERQRAKYEYMDRLFEQTQALLDEGRPAIVCGDINICHKAIDIHNPKGNAKNSGFLPEERAWFDRWLTQGWVDTQRALNPEVAGLYSWWSNRGRAREKDLGWRIDYLLATPSLAARANKAWIERHAGLSDHAPCFVQFDGELLSTKK
jgi:exodeoxyribonuclease III